MTIDSCRDMSNFEGRYNIIFLLSPKRSRKYVKITGSYVKSDGRFWTTIAVKMYLQIIFQFENLKNNWKTLTVLSQLLVIWIHSDIFETDNLIDQLKLMSNKIITFDLKVHR